MERILFVNIVLICVDCETVLQIKLYNFNKGNNIATVHNSKKLNGLFCVYHKMVSVLF